MAKVATRGEWFVACVYDRKGVLTAGTMYILAYSCNEAEAKAQNRIKSVVRIGKVCWTKSWAMRNAKALLADC